jgi:phosphinothricin acetyltransferase
MIRPVRIEDGPAIREIYNYYIEHTVITFDEEPLAAGIMESRIRDGGALYPWIVWEEAGEILGYAYLHQWRDRAAYRFSAEDSIYVREDRQGRGIGGQMLACLLEGAKKSGLHTVIAGITLPNERSVSLHEKFGFRESARFGEVGYKFNAWLDVGYWELILRGAP